MSDEAVFDPSTAPGELTAGALLRQAREATGLHIAALAVSLKVPVKKLEALEADRLQELPDAVFVRALTGSVCRTLKIDPAPILKKLPQSVLPKLDKEDHRVSLPLQGSGFMAGKSLTAFVTRPTVLLVLFLLLGALALALFPEARNTVTVAEAAKLAPAEPVVAPVAKIALAAASAVVADKPVLEASGTPAPIAAAVPQQLAVSAAAPAKAASASVASIASNAGNADANTGLLVFKAKSRAWVRVSDSKGVVRFEKTLAAGESAGASGALPLSVIVGNVAATEVVLRGQAFPLDALNQNNVARFEVK